MAGKQAKASAPGVAKHSASTKANGATSTQTKKETKEEKAPLAKSTKTTPTHETVKRDKYSVGFVGYMWLLVVLASAGVMFWASLDDTYIGTVFEELNLRNIPPECADAKTWLTSFHNTVGQHVVCMRSGEVGKVKVDVWKNALLGARVELEFDRNDLGWEKVREVFTEQIVDRKPISDLAQQYQNPWAFFTTNGRPINSTDQLLAAHTFYLLEGGVWLWPGVRLGFTQTVELDIGNVTLRTLSLSPLVIEVSTVLLEEEMKHVIDMASKDLQPSTVLYGGKVGDGSDGSTGGYRTSSHTWLLEVDEFVDKIDERIAELSRCPKENQEHVQVVRYELGQKFWGHHDYHDDSGWDQATKIEQKWDQRLYNGFGNRLLTILWYMSDVEEGGETWFASRKWYDVRNLNVASLEFPSTCSTGLLVKPVKGGAAMFYSMYPNGHMDSNSFHAGCPVKKGTKFLANKWVWNKKFLWI